MDIVCQKLLMSYNSGLAVSQAFKGTDGKYHFLFLNIENENSYQVGVKTCTELKLSQQEYVLRFFNSYTEGLLEQLKALSFLTEKQPVVKEQPIEKVKEELTPTPEPDPTPTKLDSLSILKKRVQERKLPLLDEKGNLIYIKAPLLLSSLNKGFLFGGSVINLCRKGIPRKVNFNQSNRSKQTDVLRELLINGWATDVYSDKERQQLVTDQWSRFEYKEMKDTSGKVVIVHRDDVFSKLKEGFKYIKAVAMYNPTTDHQLMVRSDLEDKENVMMSYFKSGYTLRTRKK